MNRRLTFLLTLPVVAAAVWFFWPVDSETAIRRTLDRLESAFDDAAPRRLVSHFAEDWIDDATRADRETLRSVFAAFVLRERDPKSGQFLYDIDYDDQATVIDVVSDQEAIVDMVLVVSRVRREGDPIVVWRLSVRAEFRRESRWLIQDSERKTLEGRRPF